MRSAVSRLIEFTAKVRVRLSAKSQKLLHDSLDENLKHPNSDIQVCCLTPNGSSTASDFKEHKTEIWGYINILVTPVILAIVKFN